MLADTLEGMLRVKSSSKSPVIDKHVLNTDATPHNHTGAIDVMLPKRTGHETQGRMQHMLHQQPCRLSDPGCPGAQVRQAKHRLMLQGKTKPLMKTKGNALSEQPTLRRDMPLLCCPVQPDEVPSLATVQSTHNTTIP
jgi:hypothetical protein